MKTRQGFISNSSSSSFIVGFSKIPTGYGELEKEMFGDECGKTIDYYGIYSTSTNDIARRVFDDIKSGKAKQIHKKEALKELLHGYFPGYPSYNCSNIAETNKIRENYYKKTGKDLFDDDGDKKIQTLYCKARNKENKEFMKALKTAAKKFLDENWPKMKGKKVFVFEYGDRHSGEGVLEHGDIFEKLPCIVISHH